MARTTMAATAAAALGIGWLAAPCAAPPAMAAYCPPLCRPAGPGAGQPGNPHHDGRPGHTAESGPRKQGSALTRDAD
jgi:hypothetical protein